MRQDKRDRPRSDSTGAKRVLARAIAGSMLAAALMLTNPPARAQTYDPNYPVCMHVYTGPGGGDYFACSFTSLPQCQASASGRAAYCLVNPYFTPLRKQTSGRARYRHRRVR